jgi:hypothetical protein
MLSHEVQVEGFEPTLAWAVSNGPQFAFLGGYDRPLNVVAVSRNLIQVPGNRSSFGVWMQFENLVLVHDMNPTLARIHIRQANDLFACCVEPLPQAKVELGFR